MNEAMLLVIQQIQSMSPAAWEILIQQATNEAVVKLVWGLVFGLISVLLFWKAEFLSYKLDTVDEVPFYLIGVLTSLISASYLVSSVLWFSNPQFYAIRFLLEQFN